MNNSVIGFALLNLFGVFISAISQVLLKKSASREHASAIREYLNPLVIFAYMLFLSATLLSVISYRGIPLSMGPILDATGYIYVTIFGVIIFHERLNRRRLIALLLIVLGIIVFAAGS